MLDTGFLRSLRGPPRRIGLLGASIAAGAAILFVDSSPLRPSFGTEGTDVAYRPSTRPTIEAAFARESYRPGAVARLVVFSNRVQGASIRIFRAGTERGGIRA